MKLPRFIKRIFDPVDIQQVNLAQITEALNVPDIRNRWLASMIDELRNINLTLDHCLARNDPYSFPELVIRRKTVLWAISEVLTAKNSMGLEKRHNPSSEKDEPTVYPSPF